MKCMECGSTKELQEHHTSYDPEKTEILCVACHQDKHGHGVGVSENLRKMTEEKVRKLKRMWKRKESYESIVEELNISPMSVYKWRKKLGLNPRTKFNRNEEKLVNLECQNCGYEWDYGGEQEYYASCPRCLYKVPILKEANNER